MIWFVHQGGGGRYSHYVQEAVRKISARRRICLQKSLSAGGSYVVAIHPQGKPLTAELLQTILSHREVTFLVGDSRGVSADAAARADCVISLTALPVPHHIEALILSAQLEQAV